MSIPAGNFFVDQLPSGPLQRLKQAQGGVAVQGSTSTL